MTIATADVSSNREQGTAADDIETYIASLDGTQQDELLVADAAIDIAILLYRARLRRGLSQAAAAKRAGLQQQAVSRLERADGNPQLDSIHSYLAALGYALEVRAIDVETGNESAKVTLLPRTTASSGHAPTAARPQSEA